MNEFLEWFVGQAVSTVGIGDVVNGNVHVGHLTTVPQPSYPCVTIERMAGGADERHVPATSYQLVISVYSLDSHEVCQSVHDALKTLLHCNRHSGATTSWVTYRRIPPWDDSDRTAETVFYSKALYDLEIIG